MCLEIRSKVDFDSPKSVQQSLFKYFPNRDYHLEAFRRGELFLAKPKVLNDSFDTTNILIEPYKRFKQLIQWNNMRAEAFENHGICSFNEAPDIKQERMWAFYANNFDGYAIEFNPDEFKKIEYAPLHLLPVKYLNKPLNLDDLNLRIHVNDTDLALSDLERENNRNADYFLKCLHLIKDRKVWKDEHEWRLIKAEQNPLSVSCQEHVNRTGFILKIGGDAYQSLYIGYRVSSTIRDSLSRIAAKRHMHVFIVTPQIINGRWDMLVKPV